MKNLLLSFFILTIALRLFSQNECENFNTHSISNWASNNTCNNLAILDNWETQMARVKYESFASQEGNSDIYLQIRDISSNSCQSWAFNPVDYKGQWATMGQCLCYDFVFFEQGSDNTPPSLMHIYSGASDPFSATYLARFVLNDPVTTKQGWVTICPPLQQTASGLPANSLGYWEILTPVGGGAAEWNALINNVSGIAFKVDINNGTEVYGVDNICFKDCPKGQEPIPQEPPFCCGGKNLIVNGSFESGNTGFSNECMHQATISANSVVPGQYSIVNGNQAATVSSNWSSIQDPSYCLDGGGKFLVVNGENGGGTTPSPLANSIPPTKVIWEQTVAIKDWRGYKFCFRAKNLDQCGFNIMPKINVLFSMPIGNILETITAPSGGCDWFEITKGFNLWGYGNSLNIKIVLDQSQFGDGNDIALDDISLTQLEICPAESAEFDIETVTPHPNHPNAYGVSATADIVLPCESIWWEVCRLNLSTSDCETGTKLNEVWWSVSTNFQGYVGTSSPSGLEGGLFKYGEYYRITRGTWGECNSWRSSSIIIQKSSPTARMVSYSEKEFKAKKKDILKKEKRKSRKN